MKKKLDKAWRQNLAVIASEFPGQFPGEQLYSLDVRDLNFWLKEAKRKHLRWRYWLNYACRLAMSTGTEFRDEMTRLEFQMKMIDSEEED